MTIIFKYSTDNAKKDETEQHAIQVNFFTIVIIMWYCTQMVLKHNA